MHSYPKPIHDCVRATRHIFSNAAEYNIDPTRVVLAGDSAGKAKKDCLILNDLNQFNLKNFSEGISIFDWLIFHILKRMFLFNNDQLLVLSLKRN